LSPSHNDASDAVLSRAAGDDFDVAVVLVTVRGAGGIEATVLLGVLAGVVDRAPVVVAEDAGLLTGAEEAARVVVVDGERVAGVFVTRSGV